MAKGKKISNFLKPLLQNSLQTYLGTGLHTLGLLGWILEQAGPSDVIVSTFSTSEEFLSGFYNLQKKGYINHSVLLADHKASRKTMKLKALMANCFDDVYLGENHSKIVLVTNGHIQVSVVTSQNQTYGGRAECTMITTISEVYSNLFSDFQKIIEQSILLNELF